MSLFTRKRTSHRIKKELIAMQEKTIEMEDVTLHLSQDNNCWYVQVPKSQTRIEDIRQMDLLKVPSDYLAPMEIEEKEDAFLFHITIEPNQKNWETIRKLKLNEKLRLLCNMAKLERFLSTRITLLLHPEMILFCLMISLCRFLINGDLEI